MKFTNMCTVKYRQKKNKNSKHTLACSCGYHYVPRIGMHEKNVYDTFILNKYTIKIFAWYPEGDLYRLHQKSIVMSQHATAHADT